MKSELIEKVELGPTNFGMSEVCLPCNTCHLYFQTRQLLSAHYKSELHRTNLILVSNHQPPLTQEQFDQKKQEEEELRKAEEEKQHKHEHVHDIFEEEEEDPEKLKDLCACKENECLFCGKLFDSFDLALEHMSSHGFRIPYPDKIKDTHKLMHYLAEKVGIGNCCVYCNRFFKSLAAARDHMIGKSHCAIVFDDELEEFYEPETGVVQCNYYIDENDEMHLPNGKIIGHKKYQRYYRQNIRPVEEIMRSRRLAIESSTKPRETLTIQNDPILRKREYFRQKYISKKERRLVSKDYHPFSDIHRGNA